MEPFQAAFIELLVQYDVVRFGEFTLKSGRRSPYFINAGQLRTGDAIGRLGQAYAARIRARALHCDLVFGPAYKGIPLAVATAIALSRDGVDVAYGFDRKEAKDHGEGGTFVATPPTAGSRVVVVDDVITSGLSIRQAVEQIRNVGATLEAVVVAVDRQERGSDPTRTTLSELNLALGVAVYPVVTVSDIVEYLHGREIAGKVRVTDVEAAAVAEYLATYGAPPVAR